MEPLVHVESSVVAVSDNSPRRQGEEDDDRDFLEDDFLDNLAVVDSCYSDPENESNEQNTDNISCSSVKDIQEDSKTSEKSTEKLKTSKNQEKSDRPRSSKDGNSSSRKTLGPEEHESRRSKERDYVSQRRSKDRVHDLHRNRENSRRSQDRFDSRRSRDRRELRRSRERLETRRNSRDRLDSRRSRDRLESRRSKERPELHRSRDTIDSRRSRDRLESRKSKDRLESRGSKDRVFHKSKDHELHRNTNDAHNSNDRGNLNSSRGVPERHYNARVNAKPIINKQVPVVKIEPLPVLDDLVPPGTEDVLLPDELSIISSSNVKKTNEDQRNVEPTPPIETLDKEVKTIKTEKRRRTNSEERADIKKKKRSGSRDSELMTRERIERDQERMSRELSIERIQEGSRERETRPAHRLFTLLELKEQRLRNERFNIELEKKRLQRIEADLRIQRSIANSYASGSGRRRRSGSSERRSSYAERRIDSRSRDRSNRRYIDLSPVSIGRMSKHSDISFDLSPVSSHGSMHEHYRGRSFSPISSGSHLSRSRSMVSISSDEDNGTRYKRRKRSPFWKEMERKLGITMTGAPSTSYQYTTPTPVTQLPLPDVRMDVSAPPPGTFPVDYPPPVAPVINFPPPFFAPPLHADMTYQNPNLVRRAIAPSRAADPVSSNSTPVPAHRVLKPVVTENRTNFFFHSNNTLPEAPPPPQISGGSSMSLTSFLEATVRVGAKNDPVDMERIARCDAAVEALGVDNVLGMISAGRFIVQDSDNLLQYTTKTRFDHPAQESMIKLKSPLLRNTAVRLTFCTPTHGNIAQKKKAVSTTLQETLVLTGVTQTKPREDELNSSDPDITFIAEVPKTGNVVIATLDLVEPNEEVPRQPIAEKEVPRQPIAEKEVPRQLVAEKEVPRQPIAEKVVPEMPSADPDMKCTSCWKKLTSYDITNQKNHKLAQAKPQFRTVSMQVDFYDNNLWSTFNVADRSPAKRCRTRGRKNRGEHFGGGNSAPVLVSVNTTESSNSCNSIGTVGLQFGDNVGNARSVSGQSLQDNNVNNQPNLTISYAKTPFRIPNPFFKPATNASDQSSVVQNPMNSDVDGSMSGNKSSAGNISHTTGKLPQSTNNSSSTSLDNIPYKQSFTSVSNPSFSPGSSRSTQPFQSNNNSNLNALPFSPTKTPPKGILKGSQPANKAQLPSFQPFANSSQFSLVQSPFLGVPGTFGGNQPPTSSSSAPRMVPPPANNPQNPSMFGRQGNNNTTYRPYFDNSGAGRY